HARTIKKDAGAVRGKVEEPEAGGGGAPAHAHGQGSEGRGIGAARRRRLQDDASLRIVIEPEVEGIESVRRVAGVVVEQTGAARAEELDLDLLRRPVVSGTLAEPGGG